MNIRHRESGEIRTDGWLRQQYPETSFPYAITPSILANYGYDEVLESQPPTLDSPYQYAKITGYELHIPGCYLPVYAAADYTPEECDAIDAEQTKAVRTDRNKRLTDCDWTQLPDAPVDATAWATYRQALRDVTAQAGFPWNVVWPEEPTT